jgi:hypothetical protein
MFYTQSTPFDYNNNNNCMTYQYPSPQQMYLIPTITCVDSSGERVESPSIVTPISVSHQSTSHVVLNPSSPRTPTVVHSPTIVFPTSPRQPLSPITTLPTTTTATTTTATSRPQISSANADIARKLKSKYSESTLREAKIFKKRKGYPKHITAVLIQWYEEHEGYPYPSQQEKEYLSSVTGLSVHQLSTWFSNTRIRTKRREQKLKNQKVVADKKKKKSKKQTTTSTTGLSQRQQLQMLPEQMVPCVYLYDPTSFFAMNVQPQQPIQQQQQQQQQMYSQQQQIKSEEESTDDVFLDMEEVDLVESPTIDNLMMQEDVYYGSCNLLASETHDYNTAVTYFD